MQKLSIIFSDIEFGAGTPTDDFVEDDLLISTIDSLIPWTKKYPTDFIFNGDTFDFLKVPYRGRYIRHITERNSLWKLARIRNVHPQFFPLLKKILKADPRTRIIFIHGNHDFDLEFPGVQKQIQRYISKTDHDRILFTGFTFSDGLLEVEHGSQLDPFCKVVPHRFVHQPRTHPSREPYLLVPWCHNVLCEHYFHIKEKYPLLERLFPRARTLELLPLDLKRKVLIDTLFYLFKTFTYTQFRYNKDRLYRLNLRELRKYILFWIRGEYEIRIDKQARRQLRKRPYKVLSYGHNHRGKLLYANGKWVLNTGSWRDEYILIEEAQKYVPKLKSYGFVLHDEKKVHKIKLYHVKSRQKPIPITEIKAYIKQVEYQ